MDQYHIVHASFIIRYYRIFVIMGRGDQMIVHEVVIGDKKASQIVKEEHKKIYVGSAT